MAKELRASNITWPPSGAPALMNCGRMAVKYTSRLGFAPWVMKPCQKAPRDDAGAAALLAPAWERNERTIMRAPIHMRYAAPAHLMTTKTCADRFSAAARLVAESAKYMALAASTPTVAAMPAARPRVMPREKTSNEEGPGWRQRSVSVKQKSAHASKVIYHHP